MHPTLNKTITPNYLHKGEKKKPLEEDLLLAYQSTQRERVGWDL